MQKWLLILIMCFAVSVNAQTARHTIRAVSSGGEVIILDDGTSWNVRYSYDYITVKFWSANVDAILVDRSKIINTDENESVEVTPLSQREASDDPLTHSVPHSDANKQVSDAFEAGARDAAAESQRKFEVSEAENKIIPILQL